MWPVIVDKVITQCSDNAKITWKMSVFLDRNLWTAAFTAQHGKVLCAARTTESVLYLSVECHGVWLALGADALRPGRVTFAPRLDATADVLQHRKLPPENKVQCA